MEEVLIEYNCYKPRVNAYMCVKLQTIPIVGDIIHMPGRCFLEVSKRMKNRDTLLKYGHDFIVKERMKYFDLEGGDFWIINITPVRKFEEVPKDSICKHTYIKKEDASDDYGKCEKCGKLVTTK